MTKQTDVRSVPDSVADWRRMAARRLPLRTILGLLLFGFLLVTAPLIAGLLVSGQQIERVTRESEALLERAVGTTQAAREVLDRLVAFERAARQYRVLRDEEARDNLLQQREALRLRIDDFRTMQINDAVALLLDTIAVREGVLADQVVARVVPEEWPAELASGFRELDGLGRELMTQSEATAARALDRLENLGARARATSLLQLALIIPFAVVLAIIFTGLINRPIRRLNEGIRALARPDAGPIPRVEGPRDLRALSVRLEWVRRKLARSERDRQRLLGQVSHELKTPLSAIGEGASLLDDRVFGELTAEQAEVISILKDNIQRLQEQIDALLRFNRLHSGLRPAEHRPIKVAGLVEDVISTHALALAARDLRARIDIAGDLQITGDRDMLRTALDNLVSNALKFSPAGEAIGVFARAEDRRVIIEITDRGPGIRPGDRNRLFEPFFRGRESANSNVPGSGLGLAICQDLVRAHGGEVRLDGRAGWTTVFRVSLPQQSIEEHTDENV